MTKNLVDILPPTKEEIELAKLVAEYVNIPLEQFLNETIEDAERRTNYKNKPIGTDPLSLSYAARHHIIYPILTDETLKKIYERIQNF